MMKMRVFLGIIRAKFALVKENVRKGAYKFPDDKVKYLILEEWKKTEKELSELIAYVEKVEGLENLMLTKESLEIPPAKCFLDFLSNRWERIRLDSPASFLIDPASPANACYIEIGHWLNNSVHGFSMMNFLVPKLATEGAASFPESGNKHILSDDESNDKVVFIDVCVSLLTPDKEGRLHHTHPGWEKKILSENEKNRVINFCQETRAYYQSIESGKRQERFKYEKLLHEGRISRAPLVIHQEDGRISYGYSEEGKKLLISHLFQNIEDLVVALQSYSPSEYDAFLDNFDFDDLSRIVFPDNPGNHFKQNLHFLLYSKEMHEKEIYKDEEKRAIFLFVLKSLYGKWLSQQSAKDKAFEDWDVIVMNRLAEEEKDRKISESGAHEDFMVFSPLMRSFYLTIKNNDSELNAVEKMLTEIDEIQDLVHALQSVSCIDMVWQEFANLFSCNRLTLMMLGLTKPSYSEFEAAFLMALSDDALFREDIDYNRRLLYWFNYLYESWRTSQKNCTTSFFGFEGGYEKQVKIEASRFIGHFLAMSRGMEDYDICLETYIRDLEKENQTRGGKTKLRDPQQVKGALQNGKIEIIISRMKEVLSPDFVPKVGLRKTA